MDRRDVLKCAAAGLLAALPFGANAQDRNVRRIAWIWSGGAVDTINTVRESLRAEGFVEGRNLVLDVREIGLAGDRAAEAVDEALKGGAELIIAQGPVAPTVHKAVAQRVPVVIAFSGDPVAAGLVDSLRRPGRRTTGVSFLVVELVGKRLEMLRELAPGAKRVALLLNSRHYGFQSELAATERTAQALGLATEVFDARAPEEFPHAFQGMTASKVQGVVVFPDALMTRMAPSIAEFSIRERVPVVAGWAAIARAGVLASYGPDLTQAYERVGH
jgi:putative ABC transport system substrate-binding protein